jgi:hypothetical protein
VASQYNLYSPLTGGFEWPFQCVSTLGAGETLTFATNKGGTKGYVLSSTSPGSEIISVYAVPVNGWNFPVSTTSAIEAPVSTAKPTLTAPSTDAQPTVTFNQPQPQPTEGWQGGVVDSLSTLVTGSDSLTTFVTAVSTSSKPSSTGAPLPTSTPARNQVTDAGGLDTSDKIALGCGIGIGIPTLIVTWLAYRARGGKGSRG